MVELSLVICLSHVPVTERECFPSTLVLVKALTSQFFYWLLALRNLSKNRRITLKDWNIVLFPPLKLFLDLPKPVRICQPGHPEDKDGEPPDVSHTVKDRNKVIHRQLNYTWPPTPTVKNLKGTVSFTTLKSCSVVGFTNVQMQLFCLPTPPVQQHEDLASLQNPSSALLQLEVGNTSQWVLKYFLLLLFYTWSASSWVSKAFPLPRNWQYCNWKCMLNYRS